MPPPPPPDCSPKGGASSGTSTKIWCPLYDQMQRGEPLEGYSSQGADGKPVPLSPSTCVGVSTHFLFPLLSHPPFHLPGRVASMAEQAGWASANEWMAAWEMAWQATLNTCTRKGRCELRPN